MFKKILVPIDGSDYSLNAAKAAIAIGEKFGGKVTFLYVISKCLETNTCSKNIKELPADIIENLKKEGYSILEKTIQDTGQDTVKIDAVLSWGNPADIIMEKAENKEYDLIVMGSKGHNAISGFLLGSVSEKVSRSANCPVMIVKGF